MKIISITIKYSLFFAFLFISANISADPTAEPKPNQVHVFAGGSYVEGTTNYPILLGSRFYQDPDLILNIKSNARAGGYWDKKSFQDIYQAAIKLKESLIQLERKGYQVNIHYSASMDEFLAVIEDPSTVGIIHENHSKVAKDLPHQDLSRRHIVIDDLPVNKRAVQKYRIKKIRVRAKKKRARKKNFRRTNKRGKLKKVKFIPSPNLQFFFTRACFGEFCQYSAQSALNLDESLMWLGHHREVLPKHGPIQLKDFEIEIVKELPDLNNPCRNNHLPNQLEALLENLN